MSIKKHSFFNERCQPSALSFQLEESKSDTWLNAER
jgi:hypothetical protein